MNRIQSYLEQLNEGNKVAGAKAPGELEGSKHATIEPLNTDVGGIEDPEEPEHLQGVTETANKEGVKYNTMSKNNVFERLYKQAINEDFDDIAGGGGMGGGDMGGGMGDEFGGGDDLGGDDEFGDDAGDIDADPSHIGKVREVIDLLQQALDVLSSFEGEEEEEYSEYEGEDDDMGGDEDFGGGEDFGSDDSVTEEEAHTQFGKAKTIGHALVSREKFNKGQDKKGNMLVKGANPSVAKGKATVPPGQKADGKLSNFSDAGGKKMQGKGNMKVPGRASNTGKFAFEG
jgi:hypothetical protein